jgi:hypothetical protein
VLADCVGRQVNHCRVEIGMIEADGRDAGHVHLIDIQEIVWPELLVAVGQAILLDQGNRLGCGNLPRRPFGIGAAVKLVERAGSHQVDDPINAVSLLINLVWHAGLFPVEAAVIE